MKFTGPLLAPTKNPTLNDRLWHIQNIAALFLTVSRTFESLKGSTTNSNAHSLLENLKVTFEAYNELFLKIGVAYGAGMFEKAVQWGNIGFFFKKKNRELSPFALFNGFAATKLLNQEIQDSLLGKDIKIIFNNSSLLISR